MFDKNLHSLFPDSHSLHFDAALKLTETKEMEEKVNQKLQHHLF